MRVFLSIEKKRPIEGVRMKRTTYSLVLLIYLATSFYNSLTAISPYLNFRSVSVNAARELVGWQTLIQKACMERCYGVFSITPEYSRSFDNGKIAQALFGNALYNRACCKPNFAFKIQGSNIPNRDENAWLADYFYLPTNFSSIVSIEPKIDTFLIDFNFYVGFDTWIPGLFLRAHAPLASTRWDLGFCETNKTTGNKGYPPGYFNDTYTIDRTNNTIIGISTDNLLNSFEEYIFSQESITGSTISYEPLHHARMSKYRLTKTRLAEIQVAFGYNILLEPTYHLGLEARVSIPTGNTPKGEFLLEPIVGNGHHAELGAGLTTHWDFWSNQDNTHQLGFYLDANISHLFKSHQCRTFDLKNKPLSRYMIAMDMRPPVEDLVTVIDSTTLVPQGQFKYKFTPVANITTIPVDVTIAVQADIALKLAYTYKNIQWDIGYDFWMRSCEQIVRRTDSCCQNKLDSGWAIKGDSFIFGFAQSSTGISSLGSPLAASQSNATIFNGTNNWSDKNDSMTWNQNPGVDAPKGIAYNNSGESLVTHQWLYTTTWDPVYTSEAPQFITAQDLDMCGAQTKGLSHKLFTHINYIFDSCSALTPYIGIGCEIEFGKNTLCKKTNNQCSYYSLSQWGLWLKGGLEYN
jgi:hypothetical protein